MAESKTLAGRIATIASEIGAIAKDGKNTQQGYAFIQYGKVAARIRELQAKHGVAIIPNLESYECHEVQNKYKNIGYHYLLRMEFTIINTDDKEDRIITKWIAEATDYGDKGINKAITSGVKYFIMRLYNISEKGEQEAGGDTPEPAVKPGGNNHKPDSKPPVKIDQAFLCKVRGKLALIKTDEELDAYWKELNLNKQYRGLLLPSFKKRRGEIANGVE